MSFLEFFRWVGSVSLEIVTLLKIVYFWFDIFYRLKSHFLNLDQAIYGLRMTSSESQFHKLRAVGTKFYDLLNVILFVHTKF